MIQDEDLRVIEAWLRLVAGKLEEGEAKKREDVILAVLRFTLDRPEISADAIRLDQKFIDDERKSFPEGLPMYADLFIDGDECLVFDTRCTYKLDVIGSLAMKIRLIAKHMPDKQVRGIFIALSATDEVIEVCNRYGIELLDMWQLKLERLSDHLGLP